MAAKFARFHEKRSYGVCLIDGSFCLYYKINDLLNDFSTTLQTADQDMFDREDDEELLEVEKATLDVPISEVNMVDMYL